jgi:hypothetical protein
MADRAGRQARRNPPVPKQTHDRRRRNARKRVLLESPDAHREERRQLQDRLSEIQQRGELCHVSIIAQSRALRHPRSLLLPSDSTHAKQVVRLLATGRKRELQTPYDVREAVLRAKSGSWAPDEDELGATRTTGFSAVPMRMTGFGRRNVMRGRAS